MSHTLPGLKAWAHIGDVVFICLRGRWAFMCLGGLEGRGRVGRCVGVRRALIRISGVGGRGRVRSGDNRPSPLYMGGIV